MKNKLYARATHYNSSHKGTQILMDFANEYNEWASTYGKEQIVFPLTERGVKLMTDELDFRLAPEHCIKTVKYLMQKQIEKQESL